MRIIYAKRMGFCQGVRRAYESTAALAAELGKTEGDTYILGELVHNSQVVDRITGWGIKMAGVEGVPPGSRVIIRTHGETKDNIARLAHEGNQVVDLTCAVVKSVRERALQLQKRHPAVVVVGKKDHPEVQGLVSYLETPHVVTSPEEVASLPHYASIGVVEQTTISRERYAAVLAALVRRWGEMQVEALDTICPHTDESQSASRETASCCDIMLVVGDAHSSNTRRLFEVCAEANPNARFLSSADELDPQWFPPIGAPDWETLTVGITAGASTPDWVIAGIAEKVERLGGRQLEEGL